MTNDQIQSILGAKTVSFNSLFAKATGSVTAAVFLSQAVFWQEKSKYKNGLETMEIDGEIYFSKTAAEWYEETGLSIEQQKTARVPLVKSGILKERRVGLPAKMYFRIDIETLVSGISGYLNTGRTVSGFSVNRNPEIPRTGKGKFRKQDDGNSGSTYIESIESIESKKESSADANAPLTSPFQKIGEIDPETFDLEEKENHSPHRGPALRVSLTDPDFPGVTVVEEIALGPKTKPAKTGREKQQRSTTGIHPENETVFQHFSDPAKARAAWAEWLQYKYDQHRERYKNAKSELVKLRSLWEETKGDAAQVERNISHSIGNLYRGIFAPKTEKNGTQHPNGLNKATAQHLDIANYIVQRRAAAMERRFGEQGMAGAPGEWEV